MTEQQLLRMAKRCLAILCRQDCPGHSYRPTVTRHGRKGNDPFLATLPLDRFPWPGLSCLPATVSRRRIPCHISPFVSLTAGEKATGEAPRPSDSTVMTEIW